MQENNNKNATSEQKKYYHGIMVGILCSLMDQDHDFYSAMDVIKKLMPAEYSIDFVVPDWQECFSTED